MTNVSVYIFRCTVSYARSEVLQLVEWPGMLNRDPAGWTASEADCANVALRRAEEADHPVSEASWASEWGRQGTNGWGETVESLAAPVRWDGPLAWGCRMRRARRSFYVYLQQHESCGATGATATKRGSGVLALQRWEGGIILRSVKSTAKAEMHLRRGGRGRIAYQALVSCLQPRRG